MYSQDRKAVKITAICERDLKHEYLHEILNNWFCQYNKLIKLAAIWKNAGLRNCSLTSIKEWSLTFFVLTS